MEMTTSNSFNILNKLELDLMIKKNEYNIDLNMLMEVGTRINPKRSFLFISKLLGKHLDVNPSIPKVAGHLLANLYTEHYFNTKLSDIEPLTKALSGDTVGVEEEMRKTYSLNTPTLFMGFAETATGLGHAVFSVFTNSYYVHTTREDITDIKSIFDFEEEHSHAVGHSCFLVDKSIFNDIERIVLIDDEVTTGKTALNLIREISNHFGVKKFTILSILDWRTEEWINYENNFCKDNNIEVDSISLISGEINLKKESSFKNQETKKANNIALASPEIYSGDTDRYSFLSKVLFNSKNGVLNYSLYTGRFGIESLVNPDIEFVCSTIGEQLKTKRVNKRTLVLGVGEFIYIPSRIASHMGDGIMYKSFTRSPIYVDESTSYPIKDKIEFSIYGVPYYLYNIKNAYDEVFIIHELSFTEEDKNAIAEQLALSQVKHINFYQF